VLINCLYELDAWCTSIVAQQADGTIIHDRNLDFSTPDQLRQIGYTATFMKDGDYLYDAVMFGGLTGVYTGMKGGNFSISLNERHPHEHYLGVLENLLMTFTGF